MDAEKEQGELFSVSEIRETEKIWSDEALPGGEAESFKAPSGGEAESFKAPSGDNEAAAYRKLREIDRLMGLLRFSPLGDFYLARCSPDNYVLPELALHFTGRFGNVPWAIIDEKRSLALVRRPPAEARIIRLEDASPVRVMEAVLPKNADPWEDLWRTYHRIVNNESRNNPDLQRQFMPRRYWKYLPEMET
jgi:probable DNA metabolism protein